MNVLHAATALLKTAMNNDHSWATVSATAPPISTSSSASASPPSVDIAAQLLSKLRPMCHFVAVALQERNAVFKAGLSLRLLWLCAMYTEQQQRLRGSTTTSSSSSLAALMELDTDVRSTTMDYVEDVMNVVGGNVTWCCCPRCDAMALQR